MSLDVLARIPALAALDPATVRVRAMDGHTNRMLALDTPVGGFALRLPRPGAAAAVDRQAERAVLAMAAARGLALPPLYFDPGDGTMLTRREPGRAPRSAAALRGDPAALAALGRCLRRLHEAPVELPWTFVAADVAAAHFRRIDRPDLAWPLLRLAQRLDDSVARRVPAHDDLNPGNILWQGGRPWLIDWEYAGMNDPAFDLATVKAELMPGAEGWAAFLRGWGRDDAEWRLRIDRQAVLADGIAGAWYLDQGRLLDDSRLIRLGERRLERCRAGLAG